MKSVPQLLLFLAFIHILTLNYVLAFLIQTNNRIIPTVPQTKRKLSFMDIFTSKQRATVPTMTSGTSTASVNNIMKLLKMADSFSNDPNFNVKVQVNYKNEPSSPADSVLAKERRLNLSEDSEKPKKKKQSKKQNKQKKEIKVRKNKVVTKKHGQKINGPSKSQKSKDGKKKKSI